MTEYHANTSGNRSPRIT